MSGKEHENDTIERVINEANIIYGDYKRRMKDDEQFSNLSHQAKYEYYMKIYIDFARQNPIILRYIASFGMHSPKAIKMYLKKCYNTKLDTDEAFAERQADFVKYLYMDIQKHMDMNKAHEIWRHTKDHILAEIQINKKEMEKIKTQRGKNKEYNDIARRENVKHLIQLRRNNTGSVGDPHPTKQC